MTPSFDIKAALSSPGYVWNLGQLTKAQVASLNRLAKQGTVVKEKAWWPFYHTGLRKKTIYRSPSARIIG